MDLDFFSNSNPDMIKKTNYNSSTQPIQTDLTMLVNIFYILQLKLPYSIYFISVMLSSIGQNGPELHVVDPSGVTWVCHKPFVVNIINFGCNSTVV